MPVATHNQRGLGTLHIGCTEDCDDEIEARDLLAIVEGSMSSEIYELMKRSDEARGRREGPPPAALRRGLRARDDRRRRARASRRWPTRRSSPPARRTSRRSTSTTSSPSASGCSASCAASSRTATTPPGTPRCAPGSTATSDDSRPRTADLLLAGKRLLVTGVLTEDSIAFAVAARAQEEGAEIVLTGFDRGLRITERIARRLPTEPPVLELDVNDPEHLAAVADDLRERWDGLDGVVHAIAFAPQDALGGRFLDAPASIGRVRVPHERLLARRARRRPARPAGGRRRRGAGRADFDGSVAWPLYDWMGVAKAALESVNRYLAGTSARTRALQPRRRGAAAHAGGAQHPRLRRARGGLGAPGAARLGLGDAGPVADACVFLLSDYARGITGEVAACRRRLPRRRRASRRRDRPRRLTPG